MFSISVAAELVGVVPQTLRLYEARGLIRPERTPGGTRRYSHADLARLRRISQLLEAGVNLAGVAMVLELEAANAKLAEQLASAGPAAGGDPRVVVSEADGRHADGMGAAPAAAARTQRRETRG